MRFLMVLLGIIVGIAGFLISGTVGFGVMGLGAILFLWGLFSRKKKAYENYSGMRPGLGDAQVMPRMRMIL